MRSVTPGARYLAAFGRSTARDGWYSFDKDGMHFVALVNVFGFETIVF